MARKGKTKSRKKSRKQFDSLDASALFCPDCNRAMPVVKRLAETGPGGDHYEYLCQACGRRVGDKFEKKTGGKLNVVV